MKAKIKVTLKNGVLDPQGKAIEGALGSLGFSGIEHVRQGKYFEIDLKIEGKAEIGNSILFAFDLVYGGVFRIQNVPQESIHPVLMIECPRLLFPFAREIIASAVRNGGFPPLYIDPVDFVGLYRQKLSEQTGQQQPS